MSNKTQAPPQGQRQGHHLGSGPGRGFSEEATRCATYALVLDLAIRRRAADMPRASWGHIHHLVVLLDVPSPTQSRPAVILPLGISLAEDVPAAYDPDFRQQPGTRVEAPSSLPGVPSATRALGR